jgi:hypothetical protein
VAGQQALPAGKVTLRFEFAYDGGGDKGGMGTLFVNGKKVASGRVDQTQCCAFSGDEGADVGSDAGTPVTEAYKVPFMFTGKIDKVTIDLTEVNAAGKDEVNKTQMDAKLKKGLSD